MSDGVQQETADGEVEQENWFLLMDPEWEPGEDDDVPPLESVLGAWPLGGDGTLGRFRGNPDYRPLNPDSPTDPLDAVLRRIVAGMAEPEELQPLLRDLEFELAMNGDGRPLIIPAPDDALCALIVTAEQHRERVLSPAWRRVILEELIELLDGEFDVLFNPNGPASVRLAGDFVRAAQDLTDDEVSDLYRTLSGQDSGLDVVRWEISGTDAPGEGSERAGETV